jgi:dTDP-glucose 4,6-dehydratase
MKKILLTGGAGFIGSHFFQHLREAYPNCDIHILDKLTYAASLNNLNAISGGDHNLIKGDIADSKLIYELFDENQYAVVFHLAAESHVDNSIKKPDLFVQTNINGTYNLLDACRKFWLNDSFNIKTKFKGARFIHVSTDEVYGSLGAEGFFTEETAISPNSPYSASKASSDLLVRSFVKTYGLPAIITNCSNNFGPHQHDEKLIPTVIRKALASEEIPVYGDGKNVRDWIYVKDHCRALLSCYQKGLAGQKYNIGGEREMANIDLVKMICNRLDILKPKSKGLYQDQIKFVKDRPGHDWRYAVCIEKIKHSLGWRPSDQFQENFDTTILWYLTKYS